MKKKGTILAIVVAARFCVKLLLRIMMASLLVRNHVDVQKEKAWGAFTFYVTLKKKCFDLSYSWCDN